MRERGFQLQQLLASHLRKAVATAERVRANVRVSGSSVWSAKCDKIRFANIFISIVDSICDYRMSNFDLFFKFYILDFRFDLRLSILFAIIVCHLQFDFRYRLSIIDCRLPIIDYRSSISDHRFDRHLLTWLICPWYQGWSRGKSEVEIFLPAKDETRFH